MGRARLGLIGTSGWAEMIYLSSLADDPNGSIVHKFRVTEEGINRLTAERDRTASGLAETLGDWTSERLERFIADLERFNTDIESMTGRPWPRTGRTPH